MSSQSYICRRCAVALRPASFDPSGIVRFGFTRSIQTSSSRLANPLPVTGAGPPPGAPLPAASQPNERVARAKKQAELLQRGRELRQGAEPSGTAAKASGLRKRFWKEVLVKTQEDGSHTIHLDHRPVRTPVTKSVLPIPPTKPHLATAIALEWDTLTSAQQALKTHNIPLTSMASRACDIESQDAEMRASGSAGLSKPREEVVKMMLRYLDTDTLLCWAPERGPWDVNADLEAPGVAQVEKRKETLRDQQIRVAQQITSHLTSTVWPGVTIKPVLETDSILPTAQPQETQDVIRGWLSGLGAWELAGLERAVLASKSLCVATRLLIDWAEAFRDVNKDASADGAGRFGIEDAAEACSLEVSWQTAMWGEVEDTHDVDKEDMRRQLGSVVLLVSGTT